MEKSYAALNPFLVGNSTSEILDGIDDDSSKEDEDPLSMSSSFNDYSSDEEDWDEVGSISKDKDVTTTTTTTAQDKRRSIYKSIQAHMPFEYRGAFTVSDNWENKSQAFYYAHKAIIFKLVFGLCLFIMMGGITLHASQDVPHSNDYLRTSSQDEDLEIAAFEIEGEPINEVVQTIPEKGDLHLALNVPDTTTSTTKEQEDKTDTDKVEKEGDTDNHSSSSRGNDKSEQASSKEEDALPVGWKSYVEDRTGRTYYYNTKDKTTTWTRPTEPVPVSSEVVAEGGASESSLLRGGTSKSTSRNGDDHTSKASKQDQNARKEGPLPDGWEEYVDDKRGRTYYYNTKDKTTTWTRPKQEDSSSSSSSDSGDGERS
ncbi:Inherit from KOG: E3 ubiquitin- protein ligase [Seminavis robusta]|uniref:Inherit from KOG: E3 ubiquitin- protein ligase n=1 Tax=Seminavis robusta TaxID=568900 RepID=A0A9N8DRM1_9STRA|nr:Inherit from KOG: E3 ubiquitin- protein ligase [Seminavis robusta]|eukprot:Sro321_g116660.1 Inherit from KOG: E3 ubiquitin- protein ligase (371) ;mRNA; f:10580-11692